MANLRILSDTGYKSDSKYSLVWVHSHKIRSTKQTTEIGYQDAVMQNQHILLEGKTGADLKGKENSTATKTCHLKIHYFLEDDQRQTETYVGSLDTLCDCSQYWYSLLLAFYCMLDHIGTGLNQFKWSTRTQCQWNVILLHLIWEYDFYFEEGQQGKGHTSHCVNMKYFKRKGYFYDTGLKTNIGREEGCLWIVNRVSDILGLIL